MTTLTRYPVGQTILITTAAPFRDSSGAAVDPTTVTLTVERPDEVETVYTYLVDAALVRTALGTFQAAVTLSQPGYWVYRWKGVTGTSTVTHPDVTVYAGVSAVE